MPPSETPTTADADRLVRAVLAGDTAAFAGLVKLYEADVWRIAAALLCDRTATENLVQQVFVDAYTHLDQYRPGSDFGAWMRTVARNRLRKELRTAAREDRKLAAYREVLAERLRADDAKPTDDGEAYLAALRGCRERLPDEDAALLRLRYERGQSFEAIAAARGQTPAAVQRMISRIRVRLRLCIEGQVHPA
jgi:RNA polymerase sigma-70 factor, ECF subfamily